MRSRAVMWVITALALVALVVFLPATLMGGFCPMCGAAGWMMLFPLILVSGLVLLLVWVVRQTTMRAPSAGEDGALAALRERYARGDIGREEYERIREDIARDSARR